jgi:uncharacterized protein (DUF1501 family)
MDRRRFLTCLASGAALLGTGLGYSGAVRAAGSGRVLVVVFLRGGWDGLNVAVPYGDDVYHTLRPGIRIPSPAAGDATSALDLDGFFGFHPAMTALHRLYLEGRVAVLPAVHYPGASRSHFEGQDILEDAALTSVASGWLARYLAASPAQGGRRALSLTSGLPRSLSGASSVAAYSDLAMYLATTSKERTMLSGLMAQEYARPPAPANPSADSLNKAGLLLLQDIDDLQAVNALPVEGGAVYPQTTFGRQMRQAAGLVKAKPDLEVITLDLGSWDTHRGQGGGAASGAMSRLLAQFSDAVGAFFQDIGAHGGRVTLLAGSEFGRTAAENGSGGTDHGHATTWLAVGGAARGGIHVGSGWPGLAPEQLHEGRYLAHSIDFRDVYGECLTRVLGLANAGTVITGHSPQYVGFLA